MPAFSSSGLFQALTRLIANRPWLMFSICSASLASTTGWIEIRLDRGDDLDPARQCRERRRGAPRLELVEILLMRVDRVLGDQRRIVAEPLGRQHEIAVALPRSVIGFFGILIVRRVSRAPEPRCRNEAVVSSCVISFSLFALSIERKPDCYSPKRAHRSSNEMQKDNLCRAAHTEQPEILRNE